MFHVHFRRMYNLLVLDMKFLVPSSPGLCLLCGSQCKSTRIVDTTASFSSPPGFCLLEWENKEIIPN